MRAVNIHWAVDYDADGNCLPTEVEIPKELTDEVEISDWLSDTYGFCHGGFKIEMTEEERQNYCKGCARSIYSDGPLGHSCDMNVADKGYYNHANYPCYTRVTVTGFWIPTESGCSCSECNFEISAEDAVSSRSCPNCHAMIGEQKYIVKEEKEK